LGFSLNYYSCFIPGQPRKQQKFSITILALWKEEVMDFIKARLKAYLQEQREITKILSVRLPSLCSEFESGGSKIRRRNISSHILKHVAPLLIAFVRVRINVQCIKRKYIYIFRLFALLCFYFQLSSNNFYKCYILSCILVKRQVINGYSGLMNRFIGYSSGRTIIICNTILL
jgi:hypothetical protein